MARRSGLRLVGLLAAIAVALSGVVVRLAYLQVADAETFVATGLRQRLRVIPLPAERGRILDRVGTPLAITLDARDVYANPSLIEDPDSVAARLAPVLDTSADRLRSVLSSDGTFQWVARQVDVDLASRIAGLELPGIGFLPSSVRSYPAGSLAPQVLGFVGVDGGGIAGLELAYDEQLTGVPGRRSAEVSPLGSEIPGGSRVIVPARPGLEMVTTLDRQMQYQAQAALARAVRVNGARGGSVIVLDPRTGHVLVMANHPWFDPNRFPEYEFDRFRNRAVTDVWEPGSVNKVITAAAAIESGEVALDERFAVPSTRRVAGELIHDSHPHPVERMTIGDIIARSSNIGSSMLADRVGSARLLQYLVRFGYGRPTGVGFPGEAAGVVPPLAEWSPVTRATVSFGQGVSATLLQMTAVYATVANGGTWVQPTLVAGWRDASGELRATGASPRRRVIGPSTAGLLTRMLAYVVEGGTGSGAQIPGYQVAGKTGTAKKLNDEGRYTRRYVASFVGFLPASNPQVVVAVMLDEPRTVYGGVAAAPLFQEVARYAIQRLGIEASPAVPAPPHVRSGR
jgi:cell division protein FtsI (penicillin-binding protein 3)